jgi:predicted enzyme related to lactoylglutathione lyase
MSQELPVVPAGSGKHPIPLVVLSANRLSESRAFYTALFGWEMLPLSSELVIGAAPTGPTVSLRANTPDGFPGVIPFISVPDVVAALESIVAAGGAIERAPWNVPMAGTVARFKDPSGTIYGLMNATALSEMPRVPMPLGSNPKPAPNTICSLEMYAADHVVAARFFGDVFGWSTLETMPHYLAFDPGASIGGVFQGHTPTMRAVAYIYVPDVAAKLSEIDAAGGKRMGEPMQIPGTGTFGYFTDPSGTNMGLIGE